MKYSLKETKEDYSYFEITGIYSLDEGKKMIEEIYNHCMENKIHKLLVDITKKDGIIPNFDRFVLGELIAKLFSFRIKLAVIGKKDQINKFSETVAHNRGSQLFIFSDKTEALEWLMK
ncbi:MAG TPA: DUF4180 domain-containing protein [Candidatus Acidoferrales bacterium]|nr:DUF4180 domain-containing protein [Candidatus Acidoferrales bacterium]